MIKYIFVLLTISSLTLSACGPIVSVPEELEETSRVVLEEEVEVSPGVRVYLITIDSAQYVISNYPIVKK